MLKENNNRYLKSLILGSIGFILVPTVAIAGQPLVEQPLYVKSSFEKCVAYVMGKGHTYEYARRSCSGSK